MRNTAIRTSILALAAWAVSAPPAAAQGATDYTNVEMRATKIGTNLYTLEAFKEPALPAAAEGGRMGALIGPDGVFLVDAQYAPLTQKVVAAIKQITDKPIRFLVNTHVHGDHTGGNENFGKMGIVLLGREELRARMANPPPGANGAPGRPAPAAALATVTYRGPVTFHMNGEDIELIPVPRAHTDGDTMVRFPAEDVIMTGDFYRSIQYPNIDRANGGSLNGLIDGLGAVVGLSGPNTKIIPGHGRSPVDRNAVAAHRDMVLAVRDRVAKLISQGKTQEEVVAAGPANDFDSKIVDAGTTRDRFVGQVYAELKGTK